MIHLDGAQRPARRLVVAALAAVGLAIAAYLTLFQLKVVHSVWDPFGLGGSAWILRRSPLVRWLGFPDASFGVVAYAADLALDLPGGANRAHARPWQVLLLGLVAFGMAVGSLGLVVLQAVYGHWCSLCLVSAAASVAIAALVADEVRTAVDAVRGGDRPPAGVVDIGARQPGPRPDAGRTR